MLTIKVNSLNKDISLNPVNPTNANPIYITEYHLKNCNLKFVLIKKKLYLSVT